MEAIAKKEFDHVGISHSRRGVVMNIANCDIILKFQIEVGDRLKLALDGVGRLKNFATGEAGMSRAHDLNKTSIAIRSV